MNTVLLLSILYVGGVRTCMCICAHSVVPIAPYTIIRHWRNQRSRDYDHSVSLFAVCGTLGSDDGEMDWKTLGNIITASTLGEVYMLDIVYGTKHPCRQVAGKYCCGCAYMCMYICV